MQDAAQMPPRLSSAFAENWDEITFSSIKNWQSTDHIKAFAAFKRCAGHALQKPYRDTQLGLNQESWSPVYHAALAYTIKTPLDAKRFFETHFSYYQGRDEGFVTGFYEPKIHASLTQTEQFSVPLLSRPKTLVKINPDKTYADIPKGTRFARQNEDGPISAFDDRATIEKASRAGQFPSKPIAFVGSKVDAFFIHVQGAAKLIMPDGTAMRISFDGKSGHDFTGPGRILAELGEIPLKDVTMQSIRKWFAENPDRTDEILWQNRSYIFFKEIPLGDIRLGPIAAAKVQMQPNHALAVDRTIHRFGTPIFVTSESLNFAELMIAQDTGSAIQGMQRGDIFTGCGEAAGERAGVIKHPTNFTLLLPKQINEAFVSS